MCTLIYVRHAALQCPRSASSSEAASWSKAARPRFISQSHAKELTTGHDAIGARCVVSVAACLDTSLPVLQSILYTLRLPDAPFYRDLVQT